MAYLVQTLASGLDLTGYAHLVLHNDGFLVSSPARHCIYYVENGVATVWAGADGESGTANGNRLTARFNSPCGLTKDNSGNIYISDKLNHVIRKIDVNGMVTTFAGTGVAGYLNTTSPHNPLNAQFNAPRSVAVDSSGNITVIAIDNYLDTYVASKSLATESYVSTAISNLIDSAPSTLNLPNLD